VQRRRCHPRCAGLDVGSFVRFIHVLGLTGEHVRVALPRPLRGRIRTRNSATAQVSDASGRPTRGIQRIQLTRPGFAEVVLSSTELHFSSCRFRRRCCNPCARTPGSHGWTSLPVCAPGPRWTCKDRDVFRDVGYLRLTLLHRVWRNVEPGRVTLSFRLELERQKTVG
jgi:hypothetical protein